MSSPNSTTSMFVRPAFFIIGSFANIPYINYYFVFFCLCYAATAVGNIFLIAIIYIVPSLHTPKYMAILNLAIADLGEATAFLPNVMETFLFNVQEITYEACLANMFFVFFFNGMQSLTLTVLAYDRFVAICFPLRYHSIVTNTSMGVLIYLAWLVDISLVSLMVAFITRLSFCKSIVIDSYFCDHGPIYRLACNDYSINKTIALFNIVIFIFLPLTFIGLSYTGILLALFKISSWKQRIKALKTCLSHLMLVSVFYIPVLGIYMAATVISFHPNVRIISTSFSNTISPVLNPIVYALNTAEMKEFVKTIFRSKRHKSVVPHFLDELTVGAL